MRGKKTTALGRGMPGMLTEVSAEQAGGKVVGSLVEKQWPGDQILEGCGEDLVSLLELFREPLEGVS